MAGDPQIALLLSELVAATDYPANVRLIISSADQHLQSARTKSLYHWSVGLCHLSINDYEAAITHLDTARKTGPPEATLLYYLALSHLRGRRPRRLRRPAIEQIDQLLITATQIEPTFGPAHWLQAIVRDDYYNEHRLNYPPPTVEEIAGRALQCRLATAELSLMLMRVPALDNPVHHFLNSHLAGCCSP